jgi:hypothetical protein
MDKTIKEGCKVNVYQKPISLEKFEGAATVTKIIRAENWNDKNGNQIVRCNVRFNGDSESYVRDVSEKVKN